MDLFKQSFVLYYKKEKKVYRVDYWHAKNEKFYPRDTYDRGYDENDKAFEESSEREFLCTH